MALVGALVYTFDTSDNPWLTWGAKWVMIYGIFGTVVWLLRVLFEKRIVVEGSWEDETKPKPVSLIAETDDSLTTSHVSEQIETQEINPVIDNAQKELEKELSARVGAGFMWAVVSLFGGFALFIICCFFVPQQSVDSNESLPWGLAVLMVPLIGTPILFISFLVKILYSWWKLAAMRSGRKP